MRGATRTKFAVGAIAIALAATACSSGSSSSSGSSGDGIVAASWGAPQNPLMPGDTNEIYGSTVIQNILTGLVSYDPKTTKLIYENAESITSTDGQNYTIKLKPGWKFTDGTPVTAASYVDAWNYAALSTNAQLNSYYFSVIKGYGAVAPTSGKPTATTLSGLKVVNDTTFTVALNQKFATWPQSLGFLVYDPLPTSFFKSPTTWAKNPVGDGEYKISSYTPNQAMNLVPNADYQGTQKVQNKGVDLKVYTSPTSAFADLQSNKLDIDNNIPTSNLTTAKTTLNGRFATSPSSETVYMGFPMYQSNWNTAGARLVRQGLSMAIDRPTITKKILNGIATPATDFTSPVLGVDGGYKAGLCGSVCDYNPTEAKKMIEEGGGIPGGQLTLSYNSDGPNADWINAVCNSINNTMGSNTACVGKPYTTFASFRTAVTNKQMTSAFRSAWSMDYPLASDYLQPLFTTSGSSNDSHYSNSTVDSLVSLAFTQDTPQSNADLQKAEVQLTHDMPMIPLWYQDNAYGWSANAKNVSMDAFGVPVYYAITK